MVRLQLYFNSVYNFTLIHDQRVTLLMERLLLRIMHIMLNIIICLPENYWPYIKALSFYKLRDNKHYDPGYLIWWLRD